MNSIDKRKMLEGVLFNYHITGSADAELLDMLEAVKVTVRNAGYVLMANKYGQIEVLKQGSFNEVARAAFI